MENSYLRKRLLSGQRAVGVFLNLNCPNVAEVFGYVGYDFVVIDRQHSIFSDTDTEAIIRGAQLAGIAPFIRIPFPSEEHIIHALDSGAEGLIIPGVTSVESARQVALMTKFFPQGKRGMNGGARAARHGFIPRDEYMNTANARGITMIMLESEEMLQYTGELMDIENLDGMFIGPADLSQDMGIPGNVTHPDLLKKVKMVCDCAAKADKFVGIFAKNTKEVKTYLDLGASMVIYGTDLSSIKDAAATKLADFQRA